MIDKEFIRNFVTLLDTFTVEELDAYEVGIMQGIEQLQRGSDARRDLQFILRRIQAEKIARIEVLAIAQKKRQQ